MAIRFIYFDLGNVLLKFSHEREAEQIAALAGVSTGQIREILFDSGLELEYERGALTTQDLYERICQETTTKPDYDALVHASSDIFELNVSIVPLVAHLSYARPLGILSNTNEAHWEFIGHGRYRLLTDYFRVRTLSFEVGATKPDQAIYEAAAKTCGVAPSEIFFMDDREENVAGALAAGFDAVLYRDAVQLGKELSARGLQFNY